MGKHINHDHASINERSHTVVEIFRSVEGELHDLVCGQFVL